MSVLFRFLLCIIAVNRDTKTNTNTTLKSIPDHDLSAIFRLNSEETRRLFELSATGISWILVCSPVRTELMLYKCDFETL